jgi:hypothetical protein
MYEEENDVYVGGSSSGYYESGADGDGGGAYQEDDGATDAAPLAEPEFLKQDRMQKQALEAGKMRLVYQTYRPHPLSATLAQDLEQAEGTWNERFQALIDMEDSFAKYDKLRSTVRT